MTEEELDRRINELVPVLQYRYQAAYRDGDYDNGDSFAEAVDALHDVQVTIGTRSRPERVAPQSVTYPLDIA
jgi:hypothetical protein